MFQLFFIRNGAALLTSVTLTARRRHRPRTAFGSRGLKRTPNQPTRVKDCRWLTALFKLDPHQVIVFTWRASQLPATNEALDRAPGSRAGAPLCNPAVVSNGWREWYVTGRFVLFMFSVAILSRLSSHPWLTCAATTAWADQLPALPPTPPHQTPCHPDSAWSTLTSLLYASACALQNRPLCNEAVNIFLHTGFI